MQAKGVYKLIHDFCGGLIHVCAQHFSSSHEEAIEKIAHIHDVLLNIFKQAAEMNEPTDIIADRITQERLATKF
ncbi:MAG: hypothetical protein K0R12_504 [Gammaproteobacteria bacterium]|nr:hypothetical protein [Gammaproteobacteria bacterium]